METISNPVLFDRSPRWRTAVCFALALALEGAAVAAASFPRETVVINAGDASTPVAPLEAIFTPVAPEMPLPPEIPPTIPAPPPDETPEFVLEKPSPPQPRAAISVQVKATPGTQTAAVAFRAASAEWVSAPRPAYPYDARRAHRTGAGKFLLRFDAAGAVTDVEIAQSTGNILLDQVSVNAFRRWRCRPGVYRAVVVPISFTLAGAQL